VVGPQTSWQLDGGVGAWDGDLLIGYARGTLKMPFEPR
jgi:hypothetical protein